MDTITDKGQDAAFEAMIQALYRALAPLAREQPAQWRELACARVIPAHLGDRAEAFLEWARHHPIWKLTVAECSTEVCAKPREAAVYILAAMIEELIEAHGELP